MEEMKNLRDLLKHELEDLYSAEEQILEGLPGMIEKADNPNLKKSLSDHRKVTEQQKARLDKVKKMLGEEAAEEDKGFFAKLFSGSEKHHCKAMEGLIKEAEKTMEEDMEPEVKDAAIIASAQRIEHYEISGYGTAKAFALHLGLRQVSNLLDETLKEEYEADALLTDLAIGEINLDAMEDEGVKGLRKLSSGRPDDRGISKSTSRSTSVRSSGSKPAGGNGKTSNGKSNSSRKSNGNTGRSVPAKKSTAGSSKSRTQRISPRAKSGSSRSKSGR